MPAQKQMKFVQWDGVIAEIEGQIAELNTALKAIKRIRDLGVGLGRVVGPPYPTEQKPTAGTPAWTPDGDEIRSDAFFNLTIADAAVKYLRKWADRRPQPTRVIMEALDKGGLKGKAYQTVYKLLQRRAKEKKDVVNVHGDWGLAEWYLEHPAPAAAKAEKE